MENNLVQNFCGAYPPNHIFKDISSNPNFVFENDPGYSQVMLWDVEGNWVYVNSFIECEHYVLGGWNYFPPKTFFEALDLLTISKFLVVLMVLNLCAKMYSKFKEKIA